MKRSFNFFLKPVKLLFHKAMGSTEEMTTESAMHMPRIAVNQKKMYYFHGDKRWILDLLRFIDVKVDNGIDDITL